MNNLRIYEKTREVPENAKKPIKGGRLSGMTDINPMWRVKTLTDLFGPCGEGWYTEIVSKEFIPCGEEIVVQVELNLYYKIGEEWSKPINGTGGSKLVTIESKGAFINDEALKMAETDAISVCCKKLGFGADVYWSKDGESKYTPQKRYDETKDETQKYEPVPTCEICKKVIVPVKTKDGEYMSIKDIVAKSKELTKKHWGEERIICPDCLGKKQ